MPDIKNKVSVVDTFTGEIKEYEYANAYDAKNAYVELEAMYKAIERAMKKVKADLDFALGDDARLDFPDGYQLKRFTRTTFDYRKDVVAKYLDADQLDVVTKIDGTALKTLIKDLNEAGAPLERGAWQEIEESAHRKNSEYVRLIKG